jgi:hypothetical protein
MAQPTTHTQKKINRKRELNVIYFIDSDKTRSFKLSLNKVKLIAAIVSLTAIWAMSSFWVLMRMAGYQAHADRRITENQSVIFDFQTRYDQVYEQAYPKSERLAQVETEAAAAVDSEEELDAAEVIDVEVKAAVPKATPIPIAAATPVKQLAAKSAVPTVPEATQSQTANSEETIVKIEESRFSRSGDTLNLNFAIRNLTSPKKALGYMWVVASYKGNNGETTYVSNPKGINVDAEGNATNTNNATMYNIRRFKLVKVTFPSPQGVPGKFQDVKIVLMDRDGNRQSYDLPVTVNVGYTGRKETPEVQPSTQVEQPQPNDAVGVSDDVVPDSQQPESDINGVDATADDTL